MSETRSLRGPRILTDEAAPPSPRLDFGWEQTVGPAPAPLLVVAAGQRWSAPALIAAGLAVLLLGLAALNVVGFVADQYGRTPLLGWLTLFVAAGGFALLILGFKRELEGLAGLAEVERGRAAVATGDYAPARMALLTWAARMPAAATVMPQLHGARDLPTMLALLESGPLQTLDKTAVAAGRSAALQALAVTAVLPSPALDGLFIAWRGVRLVREVAVIHGLRPGVAGTLKLLRRTLFEASLVAATDVAINAAVTAVTTNPLVASVVGDAATGAVAARRMVLLARATSRACRIVPAR